MIYHSDAELATITSGSHRLVNVACDFAISKKCRGSFSTTYKDYLRYLNNNDGKVICFFCSRKIKFSGRSNPNSKYKNLDDKFFKIVDSEYKAYLLGWIASDGHIRNNGFEIHIHARDVEILYKLRDGLCIDLPVTTITNGTVKLNIYSSEISNDICRILKLSPGKKSDKVRFPLSELSTPDLRWAFLRGYFDGDGSIRRSDLKINYPVCNISSTSPGMLSDIKNFCEIPCCVSNHLVVWSNNNALDFLSKLYDNSAIFLERKMYLYRLWSSWVPSLSGKNRGREMMFFWNRAEANAFAPVKSRASDSGYDLTLIRKLSELGNVELYDTGIKIKPDYGWFFYLVGRSSIIKSGYILANSIGVIDRCYTGTVKVPLLKIDPNAPDLKLPSRLVQIIPTQIVNFTPIEVLEVEETNRNDLGFGS